MRSAKRKSGIPLIGDLPWGSHFCQFYETTRDLLDIVVPFLRAGLEANEFCVWVTSGMPDGEEAEKALPEAAPDFSTYADRGQLETIPCSVLEPTYGATGGAVLFLLDKAAAAGFDGLRLVCCGCCDKEEERGLFDRERDAIRRNNVLALFPYRRDQFDTLGIMGAVKEHRYALIRNAGDWEVIESSEARVLREELKKSEALYRSLFENMLNGFAYCRILFEEDQPADFVFLAVNGAFERLTGLRDVVGKRVSAVVPGIRETDPSIIETYGRVARSGVPEQLEVYVAAMKMWFSISVYSPKRDHFVAVFDVITERKRAEEEIVELNEELRRKVAELSDANELLRDSRLAALNMMEDALAARRQAEERSAELREMNEELERFNNVSVGRELRMIELKEEVNALCVKIGEPPRYPLEFGEEG